MAEDWRAVHAQADAGVPALRQAFLDAIAWLAAATGWDVLTRALQLNDPTSALAAIPFDGLPARLSPTVGILEDVATRTADLTLARTLAQVSRQATIGLRLTGGMPTEEIRRWAHEYGGLLIQDLTTETRRAVQGILESATLHGQSPARTAKLLEAVVGMNRRQAAALARYRTALEAEGLAGTRLERLVARYAARQVRMRALAIARTETITAANRGQLEVWHRNIREGVLRPEAWWVEWMAVEDDRLCPSCLELDGQRVRIGQPFISPTYGEVAGPALHPACRCATALVRA